MVIKPCECKKTLGGRKGTQRGLKVNFQQPNERDSREKKRSLNLSNQLWPTKFLKNSSETPRGAQGTKEQTLLGPKRGPMKSKEEKRENWGF